MFTNVAEFNQELSKFATKLVPKEFELLLKKISLLALRKIVMRNPVGNSDRWKKPPRRRYVGGRSRGNWQLTINFSPENELNVIDQSGNSTIAKGMAVLSTMRNHGIGSVIFITNNVPHIVALEHGHSKQTPHGMVAVTFAELRMMFP